MAGTIIVSSIKTDTDNSFIVRSNTGATLFSVDTTSISIPDGSITSAMIANGTVIAADVADGSITDAKIAAVANTKISGLITAGQIASVANTQITGNITQAQIATGVGGTGPAFSAYVGSAQSLTGLAFTKLALNTEEFDTNNNFDPTTNYRFTPTVAGYYQINGQVSFNSTVNAPQLIIYKNGSGFKNGSNPATGNWVNVSALIYMNGSSDYVELYGAHTTSGSQALQIGASYNYFQASLARAA